MFTIVIGMFLLVNSQLMLYPVNIYILHIILNKTNSTINKIWIGSRSMHKVQRISNTSDCCLLLGDSWSLWLMIDWGRIQKCRDSRYEEGRRGFPNGISACRRCFGRPEDIWTNLVCNNFFFFFVTCPRAWVFSKYLAYT